MQYKCLTCDGTGEVHSHNPKCWSCNGTGKTDRSTNEKEIRQYIIPNARMVAFLGKVEFDEEKFVQKVLENSKLSE